MELRILGECEELVDSVIKRDRLGKAALALSERNNGGGDEKYEGGEAEAGSNLASRGETATRHEPEPKREQHDWERY